MFENCFSTSSHENNGQGNGVLHEALPGTGTLPEELLREAAQAAEERAQGEPTAAAKPDATQGDPTRSVEDTRSHGDRGNEGARGEAASRAASAAGSGRGPDGRFLAGNRFGPGNPFARMVGLLKQAALEVCPPERYAQLVDSYLRLAEAGDLEAAKFIFPYLVGKPQASTHPDRLDFEEWQMYKESANWMAEVPALLTRPSRWMPLGAVREGQPAITQARADQASFYLNTEGKDREKVDLWLCDPEKGLGKIDQARARQQTGGTAKKKKRRR